MKIQLSLATANLGTTESGQTGSTQSLNAFSQLLSPTLQAKYTDRLINGPKLLQICHDACMKFQIQPTLGESGIFIACYQELDKFRKMESFESVWKEKGWSCVSGRKNITGILVAIKNVSIAASVLGTNDTPKSMPEFPECMKDRAIVIALSDSNRKVTRSSFKFDLKCLVVSYHGNRLSGSKKCLSHVLDWIGAVRDEFKVPVWVMGDFNEKWSECAETLETWNSDCREPISQIAYVPHRRLSLTDNVCENVIDFALCANAKHGRHSIECKSLDPRHKCLDMADTVRQCVTGMSKVLDKRFFDHDLVMHQASLQTSE